MISISLFFMPAVQNVQEKEQLTEQEIFEALRQKGVEDLSKVKKATIETNGHISVIQQ